MCYVKKHSPEIVYLATNKMILIKGQHSGLQTYQLKMRTTGNIEEFPRVNFPLKKNHKIFSLLNVCKWAPLVARQPL